MRDRSSLAADRRSVSDAVGFVLVFAIIVSVLVTVYVTGFDSLRDARQFERMNNAERAFEVLADNIEDITNRGAPSRATEIKLADAALLTGDSVTVNVTVERHGDPGKNASFQLSSDPIVYRAADGNEIVYSMGGTFRQSGEGASMQTEPSMVLGEDRIVIPIVQTRALGAQNIEGSTTILIRTEQSLSTVLVANTTASSNVTVNLTTERADAWRSYFTATSDATCPDADNNDTKVSCTWTDVDRVYVTRIAIDFEFE